MHLNAKGIAAAVTMSLVGCDVSDSVVCPADLQWRVTPSEARLAVGESVTVAAEALGCGGTQPLEEDMRWSSEDPAVATVHELTGRITAEAVGGTRIIGEDIGPYGIGPVQVPVSVEP